MHTAGAWGGHTWSDHARKWCTCYSIMPSGCCIHCRLDMCACYSCRRSTGITHAEYSKCIAGHGSGNCSRVACRVKLSQESIEYTVAIAKRRCNLSSWLSLLSRAGSMKLDASSLVQQPVLGTCNCIIHIHITNISQMKTSPTGAFGQPSYAAANSSKSSSSRLNDSAALVDLTWLAFRAPTDAAATHCCYNTHFSATAEMGTWCLIATLCSACRTHTS
jgi:hypothetical protein